MDVVQVQLGGAGGIAVRAAATAAAVVAPAGGSASTAARISFGGSGDVEDPSLPDDVANAEILSMCLHEAGQRPTKPKFRLTGKRADLVGDCEIDRAPVWMIGNRI